MNNIEIMQDMIRNNHPHNDLLNQLKEIHKEMLDYEEKINQLTITISKYETDIKLKKRDIEILKGMIDSITYDM